MSSTSEKKRVRQQQWILEQMAGIVREVAPRFAAMCALQDDVVPPLRSAWRVELTAGFIFRRPGKVEC